MCLIWNLNYYYDLVIVLRERDEISMSKMPNELECIVVMVWLLSMVTYVCVDIIYHGKNF